MLNRVFNAVVFILTKSAIGASLQRTTVGETNTFVVYARDLHSNKRVTGGDVFVVRLLGPEIGQQLLRPQDLGDGSYR